MRVTRINNGSMEPVTAIWTTHHPRSSYGIPVLVVEEDHERPGVDGMIAQIDWIMGCYEILSASDDEIETLDRWLDTFRLYTTGVSKYRQPVESGSRIPCESDKTSKPTEESNDHQMS